MENNEKKKRGRPFKETTMARKFKLRMSDDMAERLENLSNITGISRSDILRDAFNGYEKRMSMDDFGSNSDHF